MRETFWIGKDNGVRLDSDRETYMSKKVLDENALVKIKEYLDKRIDDLSKNPLYQHKCSSCGGTVELDVNKAIFICPYCGSHYALNTKRINDIG